MVINSLKVFFLIFTLIFIYYAINLNLDKSRFFWPSLRFFCYYENFSWNKKGKNNDLNSFVCVVENETLPLLIEHNKYKKVKFLLCFTFSHKKRKKIIITTFKVTKSPTIFFQQHLKKKLEYENFTTLCFLHLATSKETMD